MQNLFDLLPEVGLGIVKFPEWRYVRDGLGRNLATVHAFYRQNPTAVRSQHLLVRLLHSLNVPLSHNLERYYNLVDSVALDVAKVLKLTSPLMPGQLHKGIFYGEGVDEVLVAHDTVFDPFEAHRNWQTLEPVKVLRHPMSDLGLPVLDGVRNYGSQKGFAVISINIPMMAVQYRAFRLSEDELAGGDSQRSLMHFVRMYVLPNMLATHLDLALFNRIDFMQQGASQGVSNFRHPFYITDFSAKVDDTYENVLETLAAQNKLWTGVLRTVPAVTTENMDEAMRLPKVVPTRQVVWAILISRTNALSFMMRTSREGGTTMNQSEVNRLRRMLTMYQSDRLLRNQLPADAYWNVQSEIDDILRQVA
jgi:hypothetical protein